MVKRHHSHVYHIALPGIRTYVESLHTRSGSFLSSLLALILTSAMNTSTSLATWCCKGVKWCKSVCQIGTRVRNAYRIEDVRASWEELPWSSYISCQIWQYDAWLPPTLKPALKTFWQSTTPIFNNLFSIQRSQVPVHVGSASGPDEGGTCPQVLRCYVPFLANIPIPTPFLILSVAFLSLQPHFAFYCLS